MTISIGNVPIDILCYIPFYCDKILFQIFKGKMNVCDVRWFSFVGMDILVRNAHRHVHHFFMHILLQISQDLKTG